MEVREVDHRPDPRQLRGDREHVLGAPELADSAHDLDSKGDCAALGLEPRPQVGELLDDLGERALARAAEQEPRVEDDELRATRGSDAGRVVEHAHGHAVLLVALDMPHESRDRGVQRERDPSPPRELPELLRPGVVHPETALEVDLAGAVPTLDQECDGGLRRFSRGYSGRAEAQRSHRPNAIAAASE